MVVLGSLGDKIQNGLWILEHLEMMTSEVTYAELGLSVRLIKRGLLINGTGRPLDDLDGYIRGKGQLILVLCIFEVILNLLNSGRRATPAHLYLELAVQLHDQLGSL